MKLCGAEAGEGEGDDAAGFGPEFVGFEVFGVDPG